MNKNGAQAVLIEQALGALREAIALAVPLGASAQMSALGGWVADIGNRVPSVGQPLNVPDIETVNLGAVEPRNTNPVTPPLYIAWWSQTLQITVESTLDQDATVQVFGSDRDPAPVSHQWDIGLSRSLPLGTAISIVVNLQTAWHPYIGLRVTALALPTRGQVSAMARARRWFPPEKD